MYISHRRLRPWVKHAAAAFVVGLGLMVLSLNHHTAEATQTRSQSTPQHCLPQAPPAKKAVKKPPVQNPIAHQPAMQKPQKTVSVPAPTPVPTFTVPAIPAPQVSSAEIIDSANSGLLRADIREAAIEARFAQIQAIQDQATAAISQISDQIVAINEATPTPASDAYLDARNEVIIRLSDQQSAIQAAADAQIEPIQEQINFLLGA